MNFHLRSWRLDDAYSIAQYANNPKIAQNLRDIFPYPYRLRDAEHYVRTCIDSSPARQLLYAIDIDGHAVGSAGLFRRDDVQCKTAELGYWLGEPFWGRGIGTQIIRILCERGFAQYDIARIESLVFAQNTPSRRVLEKNGFYCEAILRDSIYKNGQLQDCCLYALLRRDYEGLCE